MTLKSESQPHRSLKVIESGTILQIAYDFLLVFYRNFVLKTPVFEIFDFKNAVTLKTGLGVCQSHWKCHYAIERTRFSIDVK